MEQFEAHKPFKRRRWEVFCAVATGYAGGEPVTSTDAYLAAFPKTRSRAAARANAARLAARPEIAARCEWMRNAMNEAVKMDAAHIRAKVVGLRLDVIDKTQHTKHKHLALQAARDLERMMGFGREGASGALGAVQEELAAGGAELESITLNVKKLMEG